MNKKIKVGILFGGKSAEHEVSLQSARNIIAAIDKKKYEVVLIGIDKKGKWHFADSAGFLLNVDSPKFIKLNIKGGDLALLPGQATSQLVSYSEEKRVPSLDVIFPVLHGTYGEDGTIQGLLKLMNIPFVGAGVLGSAVGMDKDAMKRLLRDAGLPTAKFLTFNRSDKINFVETKKKLSLPFFVKPANLGSSIGISKVHTSNEFQRALKEAFDYDNKILIEGYVEGREIECSVLGNEKPVTSLPGEVIPTHEFYSYEAKYIDENGARFAIPAKLPANVVKKVQELAIKAFKTLCLEGMARVDFFLGNNKEVIINEANTIPGFTKISMYPKLWEVSGISYPKLIDKLIQLAIERHNREKKLKTSFKL